MGQLVQSLVALATSLKAIVDSKVAVDSTA
jgi:hypothetical protein